MDASHLQSAWLKLASKTRWKVNLGWWLSHMMPMLVIAAISGFVLILIFRSRGAVVESQQVWRWALATVGLLSVVAGLIARRRFISLSQAWVRLESGMRLNNALTMAAEGRSNWPAMVAMPDDGWRSGYRWPCRMQKELP